MLSKQAAQLEERVAKRLMNRTTRRVSPKALGQADDERCLPLLTALDEPESQTRDTHTATCGKLRISARMSLWELHPMAPRILRWRSS